MKLLNLFKKKRKQPTFCYCPKCRNELISSHSFVKDEIYVYFKCTKCGKETKWYFDAPVPILIDELNDNLTKNDKGVNI